MSLKERYPRVTPARALIVMACAAVASVSLILGGQNEWIIGITAGLVVFVASTLGVRWRSQDARRDNDAPG